MNFGCLSNEELDYGTLLEVYRGEIRIDYENIRADIFAGRVSIVARSINKMKYWSWDGNSGSWVEMNDSLN